MMFHGEIIIFSRLTPLQAAGAEADLLRLGLNAAEAAGLAVGEVVHGGEANVEARGVVDGEDVDGLAVVGELPAGAALFAMLVMCVF